MLDDFSRRQGAKARAIAIGLSARQAYHESGGEKIACARRINQFLNWKYRNGQCLFARDNNGPFLGARNDAEQSILCAQRFDGVFCASSYIKRA